MKSYDKRGNTESNGVQYEKQIHLWFAYVHTHAYIQYTFNIYIYFTHKHIYIYGRRQNFGNGKKVRHGQVNKLRRAGAVKMHTSKIGNTLYTEPFWKGQDVLQWNFHIYFFPCEGASWHMTISIIICFLKGVTTFLLTCFHNSFGHGYSAWFWLRMVWRIRVPKLNLDFVPKSCKYAVTQVVWRIRIR